MSHIVNDPELRVNKYKAQKRPVCLSMKHEQQQAVYAWSHRPSQSGAAERKTNDKLTRNMQITT